MSTITTNTLFCYIAAYAMRQHGHVRTAALEKLKAKLNIPDGTKVDTLLNPIMNQLVVRRERFMLRDKTAKIVPSKKVLINHFLDVINFPTRHIVTMVERYASNARQGSLFHSVWANACKTCTGLVFEDYNVCARAYREYGIMTEPQHPLALLIPLERAWSLIETNDPVTLYHATKDMIFESARVEGVTQNYKKFYYVLKGENFESLTKLIFSFLENPDPADYIQEEINVHIQHCSETMVMSEDLMLALDGATIHGSRHLTTLKSVITGVFDRFMSEKHDYRYTPHDVWLIVMHYKYYRDLPISPNKNIIDKVVQYSRVYGAGFYTWASIESSSTDVLIAAYKAMVSKSVTLDGTQHADAMEILNIELARRARDGRLETRRVIASGIPELAKWWFMYTLNDPECISDAAELKVIEEMAKSRSA